MAYKDYVLVKNYTTSTVQLCEAPAWSSLENGDEVVLDTGHRGEFVTSITLDENSPTVEFIVGLVKQTRIPRIKAKVVFDNYAYPKAENEDNSDEQTV